MQPTIGRPSNGYLQMKAMVEGARIVRKERADKQPAD
jgi:hypothetical protein